MVCLPNSFGEDKWGRGGDGGTGDAGSDDAGGSVGESAGAAVRVGIVLLLVVGAASSFQHRESPCIFHLAVGSLNAVVAPGMRVKVISPRFLSPFLC